MAGVLVLPAGLSFWIIHLYRVLPGIEDICYQDSFPDFFLNDFIIATD